MQFGTNHLGHFLLTNELMEPLKAAEGGARVVVVSSAAHRMSRVMFDDLTGKGTWYDGSMAAPWKAYGQSKAANILFAVELNRLGPRACGRGHGRGGGFLRLRPALGICWTAIPCLDTPLRKGV